MKNMRPLQLFGLILLGASLVLFIVAFAYTGKTKLAARTSTREIQTLYADVIEEWDEGGLVPDGNAQITQWTGTRGAFNLSVSSGALPTTRSETSKLGVELFFVPWLTSGTLGETWVPLAPGRSRTWAVAMTVPSPDATNCGVYVTETGGSNVASAGLIFNASDPTISAIIRTSAETFTSYTLNITDDQMVLTFSWTVVGETTTCALYVNGVHQADYSGPAINTTGSSEFKVADVLSHTWLSHTYYVGVWNSALTAEEHKALAEDLMKRYLRTPEAAPAAPSETPAAETPAVAVETPAPAPRPRREKVNDPILLASMATLGVGACAALMG